MNAPWALPLYRFRKNLTISAGSSFIIPNPYVAKLNISLATLEQKRSDNNDIRFFYFNGITNVELNRVVYDDTNVFFPINASVAINGSDDAYFIYYGYINEATAPPQDKGQVFVPRKDSNTLSLYPFDNLSTDLGGLTPNATLTNQGAVTLASDLFYKVAVSDASTTSELRTNAGSNSYYWGSPTYPMRTIEFYMKTTGFQNYQYIVNFYRRGVGNDWNKFAIIQDDDGISIEWVKPDNTLKTAGFGIGAGMLTPFYNAWCHIAIVWNNNANSGYGRIELWLNGVLYGAQDGSNSNILDYPKGTNANGWASFFSVFEGSGQVFPWSGRVAGTHFNYNILTSFEHGKRRLLPSVTSSSTQSLGGGACIA